MIQTKEPEPKCEGRVYISGPMTNLPEMNFPAFEAAAKALRAQGYDVVSPHEVDTLPSLGTGDKDAIWQAYMREDIALLVRCQKVVRLPGWENSRGAMLEVLIAENLKMEIEDYATGMIKSTSEPEEIKG